eukprot:1144281-Pelagomonas_calceolata.AAC.2
MELPNLSCAVPHHSVTSHTAHCSILGGSEWSALSIRDLLKDEQGVLSQTVCTAYIHMHKVTGHWQPGEFEDRYLLDMFQTALPLLFFTSGSKVWPGNASDWEKEGRIQV